MGILRNLVHSLCHCLVSHILWQIVYRLIVIKHVNLLVNPIQLSHLTASSNDITEVSLDYLLGEVMPFECYPQDGDTGVIISQWGDRG